MTLQEQINELNNKLKSVNEKKDIQADHQSLNDSLKTDNIFIKKPIQTEKIITYKERWIWSGIIFIATLLPFVYHFSTQSEWTAVSFGFFIIGILLPILLLIDVKFTNGDSFDKISENGIALAISFLALSILFIGGLQYGERFSPERIKGEALQRIESQIGDLQNKIITNTPKKDSIESWDEGATR